MCYEVLEWRCMLYAACMCSNPGRLACRDVVLEDVNLGGDKAAPCTFTNVYGRGQNVSPQSCVPPPQSTTATELPELSRATCHTFPGQVVGAGFLPKGGGNVSTASECCDRCGALGNCASWTWHSNGACFLKDNAKPSQGKPNQGTVSGLHPGPICHPKQQPSMCPAGAPCPLCGHPSICPCDYDPHAKPPPPPAPKPLVPACTPPHDKYRFCNTSLSVEERVTDLMNKIPDSTKPNLLTARGGHGLQNYSDIGVPPYYWGINCLHSVGAGCTSDGHCPTNFPRYVFAAQRNCARGDHSVLLQAMI
jgi:hypothetical protein